LQIAKYRLHQGTDPQKVLDNFAYTLTQKLLHTPSVRLRKAGLEGRFELLNLAKQLFAVPDPE
jgi:glutamyl-tRNA reductase